MTRVNHDDANASNDDVMNYSPHHKLNLIDGKIKMH